MIICKICNKEYKSYKGLSPHIKQTHNMSSDNYYSIYINSSKPICKTCGKPTKFLSISEGFRPFCSIKCAQTNDETKQKIISSFKNNEENIINARNRRITYNKSEKARKISSEVGKRTGSKNLKKAHELNDNIKYCEICKKDTKHMIGIGCMTCYNRDESHKQSIINTVKERYGEEYTNVYQVPKVKEKIVQTSMERYNTSNPGNCRDARIKAAITMRGNDNQSSWEDKLEELLIENSISYKKQYSEERYPFMCDFYLPDFDMFIELNGYWSHNNHFFDSNNPEDVKELTKWKEKANAGHKQYANAVYVWSTKDLEKRSCAIKNNLNYYVIWDYNNIYEFIDKLIEQEVQLKEN